MKTKDIRLTLLKVFSGIYDSRIQSRQRLRLPCLIRGNLTSTAFTPEGWWRRVNFDGCFFRTLVLLSNKRVSALFNPIFALKGGE